jgi:hypothetical protein
MRFLLAFTVAAAVMLAFGEPGLPQASSPEKVLNVFVYPQKGQNAEKQSKDESACFTSAEQRAGVNLAGPPPTPAARPSVQGAGVVGAAHGAAIGAVGGAIGGNAGAGAGYGALAGAVVGRRKQKQANAQAEQQAQQNAKTQQADNVDKVRRAFSSCMDARGYSTK